MDSVNPLFASNPAADGLAASDVEIAAAQAYEDIFVPAMFRTWPEHVIAAAGVQAGERALDVACGTGVLTRKLWTFVGESPVPVGCDISAGMLEVARRIAPRIEWRLGDACSLPFQDHYFDRVLCQYGLMFFVDPVAALREMRRVLRPGGTVAIAVWNSLDRNPGFAEKVDALDRIGGRRAGDALRAPFCLGDPEVLRNLAEQAGLRAIRIETHAGDAQFRSLFEFVEAEVRGWLPVMDVHLDEDEIAAVHEECRRALGHYGTTGTFTLPVSAHILAAGP